MDGAIQRAALRLDRTGPRERAAHGDRLRLRVCRGERRADRRPGAHAKRAPGTGQARRARRDRTPDGQHSAARCDALGKNRVGKHIVFMGAGAVGGYVGGHLTRVGQDVTLVDPWPEHVQAMREKGLHLTDAQAEHVVKVNAIHVSDVQGFMRKPVDIAVICTKSYDTEWAAMMIRPYLAPRGYVVSMQNGINEERIARAVGWGRTVGTTVSTISVNAYEPGRIKRYQEPGSATQHNVFRVGEVH